jgi:CheY-like chemotaxis protein
MTRKRILVTDETLAADLERAGYTVRTAASGQEALWAFRIFGPDLVVLAARTRRENGYRISRILKSLVRVNDDLKEPAVLLLADSEPEASLVAFAQADAVLLSPFVPGALLEKVASLLSRAAVGAS